MTPLPNPGRERYLAVRRIALDAVNRLPAELVALAISATPLSTSSILKPAALAWQNLWAELQASTHMTIANYANALVAPPQSN
jgi:hypothetical protein